MKDLVDNISHTIQQPRAIGSALVSAKLASGRSVIGELRQEGALKLVFPRNPNLLQAVVLNTSGGITGGDRLRLEAAAEANTHLQLTTQACERAYRANSGVGQVATTINVAAGARLDWLPQELILYDGAALNRSLRIDLVGDARLLMAEPVIFGRASMGERLSHASFRDRIEIYRDDVPVYLDQIRLKGDIASQLARPAIGGGAAAMATVLYIAPDAEGRIDGLRRILPPMAAASLLEHDIIALRILAEDGFALRQTLMPALDMLSDDALPVSWRL